jgi:hypothetical protein
MIMKSLLPTRRSAWFALQWWMTTVLFDHRLSSTTCHGSQSQHSPTLILFEIRMQPPLSRPNAEEHPDAETCIAHHAIPQGIRAELGDSVKANLTVKHTCIAVTTSQFCERHLEETPRNSFSLRLL